MRKESRDLKARYERYFLREYKYRYWLLAVNNHFFDRYYFFIEKQRTGSKLVHSRELLAIKRDPALYREVLRDLRTFTQLRLIERDTHQLVHPTKDIIHDIYHGHS